MNKALILLLVTLVQSQSDGVLLPDSSTNDGFRSSQLEDWDNSESPYPADVSKDYDQNSQSYRKRTVTSDAFTRRSSLDKNFMRFGRGDDAAQKHCGRTQAKPSFYRFGRGLKDNFIRFGRARDNFIRFGRGGGKDGFIRFGRPDDLFRAAKSLKDNFIRFGKADKNFMRFGRDETEEDYDDSFSSEEPFQRPERSRGQDNFMRFGKSGKNGTNFLRFGRSDAEADDPDEPEQESKDARRKRRDAGEAPPPEAPDAPAKRSAPFFDVPPGDFPRRLLPALAAPLRPADDLRTSRLTPFFPPFPGAPRGPDRAPPAAKRTHAPGNFIRFG